MIQRIQTVYLALGAVALVGLLFSGVLWGGAAATEQGWFTPAVVVLAGVAMAVAILAIFLFKDRPKQRKVVILAQLITVVLMVALFGGLYLADALYVRTTQGVDVAMLVTLLLPLIAYLLFLLARRAVTKDIEIVRSVDRLR